jgi:hypothetical protein
MQTMKIYSEKSLCGICHLLIIIHMHIYLHVHLVLFITLIYTQIENHLIKQMW